MALFGSSTPISKIIAEGFPVFSASFMRMLIAALVLAPFVWVRRNEIREMDRTDWQTVCLIALAGMVGFTAIMLFGMRLTTGVIGATIMSATPAVTATAAVIFLGAAMNWRKGGALGLAVLGLAALALLRESGDGEDGGSRAVYLGAGLVFLAICCEAAFTLLSKRLSDAVSSLTATFVASVIAMPAFLLLALFLQPSLVGFERAGGGDWAALLFWGAATGGLAPVIWYNGVRAAPGALVAGFMAVMPVTALVLSYVLLGEAFRWAHLIGFGLVFAGVLLMIWEHAREAGEDGGH